MKKPSLWGHLTEHTSGDQVVCLKCGDILEDDTAFEQHTEKHRKTAQHTCERCGEFFLRNQQYLAHLQGHDKYRCKLCKKDFSSKKKLKIHKNSEHDPSSTAKATKEVKQPSTVKHENFTCVVCLQSYQTETLFKAHDCSKETKAKEKKANAKDVTVKIGPGRFKCKFCEFEHRKCSAVVRHARMHKNKKRFVCELCGSAFNALYTLKEHRSYVHSDLRKHNCSKCDKSFKAKNALIRHEQVHSETRPFQCHCGQQYKRASHLRRHLATSHQEGEGGKEGQYWEERGKEPGPEKGGKQEPYWDGEEQSRYRPQGQDWVEGREGGRVGAGLPISATAALDVVTSLDLNVREGGKGSKEGKQVKVEKPGACLAREGEGRAEEAVYPGPEGRAGQTYPTQEGRVEAGYPGSSGQTRLEAGYTAGQAREAGYPSSQTRNEAGYPSQQPRGEAGYPTPMSRGEATYPVEAGRAAVAYPGDSRGAGGFPGEAGRAAETYPGEGGRAGSYPGPCRGEAAYPPVREEYGEASKTYYPRPGDYSSTKTAYPESRSAYPGQARFYSPGQERYRGEEGRAPATYPQDRGYREPYLDCGPADLTTGPGGREGRPGYPRPAQAGPRQRYNNYLQQQRQGSGTYYRETGRAAHPLASPLQQLEETPGTYRPLPDLSYPRQHHSTLYFDQLDSYLHSGRDTDLELGLDKKGRGVGRREEGGLLPPLLALAPQDRPSSPPHTLKMDYLCSGPELGAQYLQDTGALDYDNIDY